MSNNTFIDIAELEHKYRAYTKLRNTVLHHFQAESVFDEVYPLIYEAVLRIAEGKLSLVESIDYLNGAYSPGYRCDTKVYTIVRDAVNKTSMESITEGTQTYVLSIIVCMAALRLLMDKYSIIDDNDVKASGAAREAHSIFKNNIETNIGYYSNIDIVSGVSGALDYKEEPRSGYGNNLSQKFRFEATIGVDYKWYDNVKGNGITQVDIGGKNALTLSAKEILGHPLESDGVRLFQSKVLYTKVPQTISTYALKVNEGASLIHIEDKVIAIQQLTDSCVITTGKDESWAVRTMRGRMKKKMMNMMDLI